MGNPFGRRAATRSIDAQASYLNARRNGDGRNRLQVLDEAIAWSSYFTSVATTICVVTPLQAVAAMEIIGLV